MQRFTPPKLADEGIEKHLKRLGVDYSLFVTLIEKEVAIGTMCNILKKTGANKPWAWETMRKWVRQYKTEKNL